MLKIRVDLCIISGILTVRLRNSSPMYLPKKNKNLCAQKDLYENGHSSFIHKTKKKGVGRQTDAHQQESEKVSSGTIIHKGLKTRKRNGLLINAKHG